MANDAFVLKFEDSALNAVKLTITATPVVPPDYVWNKAKEFYFNSAVALTGFTYDSGVAYASSEYKAAGIGGFGSSFKFNTKVSFGASGTTGAFYPGQVSTYILTGSGLTENSFNTTSTGSGGLTLLAGVHVNDPDSGPNSGKYGNTQPPPDHLTSVPEPASIALWSVVFCAGLFCRTRRRVNAAANA